MSGYNIEPADNRAYNGMLAAAKKRLLHRLPEDIAEKSGISFDAEASCFRFISLGQKITLSYPDYKIEPEHDKWLHLIALHYIDLADKIPLSEDIITFSELPGGVVRGQGFDRQSESSIGRFFGDKPPQNVKKAFEEMGALFLASNADLCAVFLFLPMYPVTVKIWFQDDEMSGSGKVLLNKSARHFLTVEDAVIVGDMVLEALKLKYEAMFNA